MSQASDLGKGGGAGSAAEESDHTLFVQKHVDYIKSLDTVRCYLSWMSYEQALAECAKWPMD